MPTITDPTVALCVTAGVIGSNITFMRDAKVALESNDITEAQRLLTAMIERSEAVVNTVDIEVGNGTFGRAQSVIGDYMRDVKYFDPNKVPGPVRWYCATCDRNGTWTECPTSPDHVVRQVS